MDPATTVNVPVSWVEPEAVAFHVPASGCGLEPVAPWQNRHPTV